MTAEEQRQYWVFAYGSLIWDPGFDAAESVEARLNGFSRSFCMESVVYRGTVERPGLVLALDADPLAHCRGLALRVAAVHWPETLAALRERELTTGAYREELVPLDLADGRRVQAVTYIMRREHVQYVGGLTVEEQARIIAAATGGRGPNRDYLFNTARHLAQIGLRDPALDELSRRVQALIAAN